MIVLGKVLIFGQGACNRQSGYSSTKVVVFGQKWLYSSNFVVLKQNGCNWVKMVLILAKVLYSG